MAFAWWIARQQKKQSSHIAKQVSKANAIAPVVLKTLKTATMEHSVIVANGDHVRNNALIDIQMAEKKRICALGKENVHVMEEEMQNKKLEKNAR